MATVLFFHSVLGLRPIESEIAAVLESDGHQVMLPDLYDGRSVDDYHGGFALKNQIGEEFINARAADAVDRSPDDVVFSGVSLGAFLIGQFWERRPKSRGAFLIAGGPPWMSPRWEGYPVSAHIARPDPFDDEVVFEEWDRAAGSVSLDLHRYDGVGHYFLDRSLQDYNQPAAELCIERFRSFLKSL